MNKIIYLVVLVLLVVGCQQNTVSQQEFDDMENFYINYNQAKLNFALGDEWHHYGNYNFDIYKIMYEGKDYLSSIEYCETAEEQYMWSNGFYDLSTSYFYLAKETAPRKYYKLIDSYIIYSRNMIDINFELYGACVHYISASEYYEKQQWDLGDVELNEGNERLEFIKSFGLTKKKNEYFTKITTLVDILEE